MPCRSLIRRGLERLDYIVAVSAQVEAELVGYGLSPERIVKIPNGVDLRRFCPAESREAIKRSLGLRGQIVTFTGRLDPQKGVVSLLHAWQAVAKLRQDASLLVLGKGPQEIELKDLAQHLDLSARIIFCGEQPDVLPYLQASDIFVLPSVAEGMPNALLEAMACGLPCVATRIGGNEELITDGINGLLVDPHDPSGLSRALMGLLDHSAEAARLGREARRTIETTYSMARVADDYVRLYQTMLRDHRRQAGTTTVAAPCS
jgi:glycosyltransferase involved in cell wall biosynthesis